MNNSDVFRFRVMNAIRLMKLGRQRRRLFGIPGPKFIITLVCLLWFGALTLRADTHYVSLDGTNNSPYLNWADAATQIQWAVNVAGVDDTVLVSNGTYNLTNQINILTNITVQSLYGTNDPSKLAIINGNYPANTNRCVYMKTGALDGFTISNGFYIGPEVGGGGILITNSGSVFNCLIYGNSVSNVPDLVSSGGGGIYMYNGGIVSNCTILSNTACASPSYLGYNNGNGGGVFIHTTGLLVASRISGNSAYRTAGGYFIRPGGGPGGGIVSNCMVDNNSSLMQAGMWMLDGTMVNCVISNNVATITDGAQGRGGGSIDNDSGTPGLRHPVVKDSVIIGNMAPNGNCGGINVGRDGIMSNCQVIANVGGSGCGGVQAGARAVVVDCVIARNSAANIGGGIRVSDSTVCVKNCLIYCNTNAGGEGGGVAFFGGGPGDYGLINCTVTSNQVGTSGGGINARGTGNNVINCIVYSNESTGDNYDELCFANGQAANTNFYWNNCIRPTTADMTPAPNQGNITNDPLFAGSSTNNYRLVASSPCVNTGTNQTWMTNALDLDGQPRIDRFSGRVDMGAYELFPKGSLFRMY